MSQCLLNVRGPRGPRCRVNKRRRRTPLQPLTRTDTAQSQRGNINQGWSVLSASVAPPPLCISFPRSSLDKWIFLKTHSAEAATLGTVKSARGRMNSDALQRGTGLARTAGRSTEVIIACLIAVQHLRFISSSLTGSYPRSHSLHRYIQRRSARMHSPKLN